MRVLLYISLALFSVHPVARAQSDIDISVLTPEQRAVFDWLPGKTFDGRWSYQGRIGMRHYLTFTQKIDLGEGQAMLMAREWGTDRHHLDVNQTYAYEWNSRVYVDHEAELGRGQILCLKVVAGKRHIGRIGYYCVREAGNDLKLEGPYTNRKEMQGHRMNLTSNEHFDLEATEEVFATE